MTNDSTLTKVALITGGTRGIGKASSSALAREGYRVYAVYVRNRDAANSLSQYALENGLDIRCIRADLTDEEGRAMCINTLRAETDHINVIVHCAASGVHRETTKITMKQMRWTFDVNVFSFHSLLAEIVSMVPPGGRIIGLSSFGATHVFSSFYGAVGSSKGALESLFRHYARELAPRGISVNIICPGMVVTDAIDAFPDRDDQMQSAIEITPTGKLATPDDVAGVVVFFASSNAAAQIIGQTINVDGGRSLY
jgi:NAD(P)-dependent dehydrogenase (short-subunit alcohol dehydrogenase family)